jgi:hypothetical protein
VVTNYSALKEVYSLGYSSMSVFFAACQVEEKKIDYKIIPLDSSHSYHYLTVACVCVSMRLLFQAFNLHIHINLQF